MEQLCCYKCAQPIPMKGRGITLKLGNDKERILCDDCANLIRKFVEEPELTAESLKKLEQYQIGYNDGYDAGSYDQWQESAGDDL